MPGKPYIKTGTSTWAKVKRIYIKSGGQTWAPIRKAYIKTGTSTWKKFFDTTSNRPFIEGNDRPKIRLNTFRPNSPIDFSGTANDPVNPVVEAPPVQQMGPPITTPTDGWPSGTIGNHLWGYDGDWKSGNGSAISYTYQWLYNLTGDRNDNDFDPAFSPAYSSTTNASNTSSTGRADMLTNNSTYLGRGGGDYFDKNFLTFRVVATNSAGPVAEESDTQLYIVRQRPSGTINLINTNVDVPETLSANFTYQNDWYRKPDLSDSYIEWFAIDSAGEALTTSNRVAIEYLNSIVTTGTTTKDGTVYHNATLANKIYSVRITLNNSNTQSAVIPISGFTPNSAFTAEDSTSPGSALEVTSLDILDYYSNEGTDNRGYIPVGGLFKINSTVTGVDGSTTYRIRYRMYNWQNNSYYGMDGTNYGSAASSAWTTRTGSSTSFGFGGTLINNITVSGTTATLTHNESISSSSFGSTTYDGGQDRWQIEIEVSALKNSVRKYYADVVGGIPYYVSRAATSTLSASPSNAQVNENVTFSGSFGGLGGGSSYPRQYRIYYGDGTDSGYLPVGEYSFGTANPSFSVTKQYTATGEYFPYIITMPDYQTTSTSLVVAAALTAPTSTSIVSMSRLNDTTVRAVIGSSGGSGPYYQLWWVTSSTAPSSESRYDAASTTSTVTEDFGFNAGSTYYFYIRSSSENLGNTTTNGTGTAGTFSAYGPTTGAAFYTFVSPSGATSSVSGSSAVGSTLTLTANSPTSAAPAASMTSIVWVVNDGGFGGNSFTGGSVLQNGGTTFVIPQYLYGSVSSVGYSIRAEVTWNNGVGSQTANSTATAVTAAAVAPSGGSVTLSPSGTQQAGTTITANVSAMSGTATISYTTTIRKKTGSAPTSNTDGTQVASGTGTGNVASHVITDIEASGTPDQFRAFTTGTNSVGSNTVASNTVTSTPAVVTQYTISWNANGGTVSPTSNTVNSGTTVSAPTPTRSGYTFLYWRDSPSAFSYIYQINPGGSWTVTSNITFYAYWQAAAVAPSTPTGVSVSGSGVVSWNAVSGADYYEVLNYTDRTGEPSNNNNRLGPYNTTVFATSLQLGSSQGYSSPNNWARAQVRAWNYAGQVSTYSAWYPTSTTYV
jgi:hypothetical protein